MYKDKDFYKRKNGNISKLEQLKNRQTKITSAFLALLLSLHGTMCLNTIKNGVEYELNHSNPFTGSTISSDFTANYQAMKTNEFICDDAFKDIVEKIRNSDMDEKKAYVLYYALLQNEYLTEEEKEKLTGYIQYFIDNKYLDYGYVYNKLSSLKINSYNPDLQFAGIYTASDNSLTFQSLEQRNYALSHEVGHAEDNSNLKYSDYAWFIEGMTCIINYEYLDHVNDGKNVKAYFIRVLCELVDPDVLFEVRGSGDINLLINALENKGVEKEDIISLFKLFNDYNFLEKNNNDNGLITSNGILSYEGEIIKNKIIIQLINIYNTVYNAPNIIKPVFIKYLQKIQSDGLEVPNTTEDTYFYYFNSKKKGTLYVVTHFIDSQTKFVTYYNEIIKKTKMYYAFNNSVRQEESEEFYYQEHFSTWSKNLTEQVLNYESKLRK